MFTETWYWDLSNGWTLRVPRSSLHQFSKQGVCWWLSLGWSRPLAQDVYSNSFSTFFFVKPQLFSSTVSIEPVLTFIRSSLSNITYEGYRVTSFHVSIQARAARHSPVLQCFPCARITSSTCSSADSWASRPMAVDLESGGSQSTDVFTKLALLISTTKLLESEARSVWDQAG